MNTHVLRTTIAVLTAPLLLLTANGVADAQEAKPPKPTTIIKCEEAATGSSRVSTRQCPYQL